MWWLVLTLVVAAIALLVGAYYYATHGGHAGDVIAFRYGLAAALCIVVALIIVVAKLIAVAFG